MLPAYLDLDQLKQLEDWADDVQFQRAWREVKQQNKEDLADFLRDNTGVQVNADALLDVLVKRLHEYKRQLLKVMHIIALHNRIKSDPGLEMTPRTFIFGAKAAPGYYMAKRIIKLIHNVAAVMNEHFINVKVDRALDDFFGDIDEEPLK